MADGLARFESWSTGEGGDSELPEAKPVPQPVPQPVPEPEVVCASEPEPEPEPEPEQEPSVDDSLIEPRAPRLPSEVKALNNGLPPSCYWDSRECEHVMSVEAERKEQQAATKEAPSPEPGVAEAPKVAATKDGGAPLAKVRDGRDPSEEYYLGKGSAMQGTGLKTNLLLTADTIPVRARCAQCLTHRSIYTKWHAWRSRTFMGNQGVSCPQSPLYVLIT